MRVLLAVLLCIAVAYTVLAVYTLTRVPRTDLQPVKPPSLNLSPAVTKLSS